MSEELKPCPFCGSEAHISKNYPHPDVTIYRIGCPTCLCYLGGEGIAGLGEVTSRWNARAQPSVPEVSPVTAQKMAELEAENKRLTGLNAEWREQAVGSLDLAKDFQTQRNEAISERDALKAKLEK